MTLEARHLSRALSIKGEVRVLINDVSLTLEAGEVLGLTGPSGSGKSTLLRVLMGLDARSAGEVLLDGEPVRAEALPTFRRVVAMLSQTPALPEGTPSLTAQDLGLELDDHLEPLGLASSDLDTPWNKLSGGEARRVRLALLVATGPRFLILDEPSSGLDTGHVAMLAAFLRSQSAAGRGILRQP